MVGSDIYSKEVLSTDTKPEKGHPGQLIIESDTGDIYEWTDSRWELRTGKGVVLSVAAGDTSASGDTTVLSVAAGKKARVYGLNISADATLTGDVYFKIGSTQVTVKSRNVIVGGVHWLMPKDEGNCVEGADGENIAVNNSVAEAISYAAYYKLVDA
jgi:hypothetical protein